MDYDKNNKDKNLEQKIPDSKTTPRKSTSKSSTQKSSTQKSSTSKSSTQKSSTSKSSTPKSSTPKSSATKNSTPSSSTAKSSATENSATKSSTPRSSTTKSSVAENSTTKSSATKSSTPKSSPTKSSASKSSTAKNPRQYNLENDNIDSTPDNIDTATNVIFGRNSVIEAIKAGRSIDKILVQKGDVEGSIIKIIGDAKKNGILVQEVEKAKLDDLTNFEKHQGVFAYVAAHTYYSLDEILNEAKLKNEDPFVLILESIQDPHNLGAIIRTALTAGVHGVIIPKHRAVGLSAVVEKASAGALEYLKVCKVTNISQTIELLKNSGIWVACADMSGEIIYKENLKGPIGVVIGSEGTGVSRNVKANCDFVVSIPMFSNIQSLNASVAAGVICYEVVRQRKY